MTTLTVTAAYDSELKVKNAFEDLVADGYPREKLFHNEEKNELKVITPEESKPEVEEKLNRHDPTKVWSNPYEQ